MSLFRSAADPHTLSQHRLNCWGLPSTWTWDCLKSRDIGWIRKEIIGQISAQKRGVISLRSWHIRGSAIVSAGVWKSKDTFHEKHETPYKIYRIDVFLNSRIIYGSESSKVSNWKVSDFTRISDVGTRKRFGSVIMLEDISETSNFGQFKNTLK